MSAAAPEKYIFVTGAPRSGTTVAHALICSAAGVSAYHPEISFFRGYTTAYRNGMVAWEQHTRAFFKDREAFRALIRSSADLALDQIWKALDQPRILCMKDPRLTPFVPDLQALFPTEALFVTTCRHPFDVVRSRQEVQAKATPMIAFGATEAAAVAREYLAYYRTALQAHAAGRQMLLRYEDLNAEGPRAALVAFIGVEGFDVDRMWGAEAGKLDDDAWGSPKYNGRIDLDPRLSPLAPELAEITRSICAPVMAHLGYS